MPKWTADKPWERQQGESEPAWEAFKAYRDMGDKRTLTAVAERLQKSNTLIRRWQNRWGWRERVRAYDNELDRQAREKAVKDRREMTQRHIGIAVQLQKKAVEALSMLDVEAMTPKDIREYIKMATELERLNRTLQTEQQQDGGESASGLADAIVTAYRKRKEDGGA